MEIEIRGLRLQYEVFGEGVPIVMLHGWGCNHHTFDRMASLMSETFRVYTIDLPGFGGSEIKRAYLLDEVVLLLREFVVSMGIRNPIIIGHSYGGRVAVIYASRYECMGLVLMGVPGVRKKRFSVRLKGFMYKVFRHTPIGRLFASRDYKMATPYLRRMLVEAVNYDLCECMRGILCRCLIINGRCDSEVLEEVGEVMHRHIKDSVLVVVEGGHFMYLEYPNMVLLYIRSFLEGIMNAGVDGDM